MLQQGTKDVKITICAFHLAFLSAVKIWSQGSCIEQLKIIWHLAHDKKWKVMKSRQKAAQNFFSDIWILMRKELFVTILRVPYVQSGHVRGVFLGKI